MNYKNESFTVRIPESFIKDEALGKNPHLPRIVSEAWNAAIDNTGIDTNISIYVSDCICSYSDNSKYDEYSILITGARHDQELEDLYYQTNVIDVLKELKRILFKNQTDQLALEWTETIMGLVLLEGDN